MKTCYRNGRVVLVLKGRYSGSKAIILGENSPNKGKSYNSYLVGGIKKYPKKKIQDIQRTTRMKGKSG